MALGGSYGLPEWARDLVEMKRGTSMERTPDGAQRAEVHGSLLEGEKPIPACRHQRKLPQKAKQAQP